MFDAATLEFFYRVPPVGSLCRLGYAARLYLKKDTEGELS